MMEASLEDQLPQIIGKGILAHNHPLVDISNRCHGHQIVVTVLQLVLANLCINNTFKGQVTEVTLKAKGIILRSSVRIPSKF
jgi:hypothetical protein